jgi:hypothetical protein
MILKCNTLCMLQVGSLLRGVDGHGHGLLFFEGDEDV